MTAAQLASNKSGYVSAALIVIAVACLGANGMPETNGGIMMSPTPHTLDILRQSECWAVAAIACDSVRLSALGTRSQAMAFSARVLAASDERIDSPLNAEQYVADQAILVSGRSYLTFLVCDVAYDGSPTWKVVQAAPLEDSDPATAVANALQKAADALD